MRIRRTLARWYWCLAYIAPRLIRLSSAQAELVLHHGFGQRYIWVLAGSQVLLWAYVSVASGINDQEPHAYLNLYFRISTAFLVYHQLAIWIRGSRETIHSRSSGVPWFLWEDLRIHPNIVARYIEPLALLLAGHQLMLVDAWFGLWVSFAGLSHLIKGQSERIRTQAKMWDAMDSRIEARQMHTSLKARESIGAGNDGTFREVAPSDQRVGSDQAPDTNFRAGLDPELKNLLTPGDS